MDAFATKYNRAALRSGAPPGCGVVGIVYCFFKSFSAATTSSSVARTDKPVARRHGLPCDASGQRAAGDEDGGVAEGLIGRLFSQPTIETPQGPRRLDDVLGDGFSMIAVPGTPASLLQEIPSEFGAPLKIRRMMLDRAGAVAAKLPDLPPGILLLRPDRYVAAFLPAHALTSAQDRIGKLFRQTWDGASEQDSHGFNRGMVHAH